MSDLNDTTLAALKAEAAAFGAELRYETYQHEKYLYAGGVYRGFSVGQCYPLPYTPGTLSAELAKAKAADDEDAFTCELEKLKEKYPLSRKVLREVLDAAKLPPPPMSVISWEGDVGRYTAPSGYSAEVVRVLVPLATTYGRIARYNVRTFTPKGEDNTQYFRGTTLNSIPDWEVEKVLEWVEGT